MSDTFLWERVQRAQPAANDFSREQHHEPPRRPGSPYPQAAVDPATPANPEDVARVLGLPVRLLTPEAIGAISALEAELAHLREAVDRHRHREAWLERQGDRDPVAPALNRRAFLRELDGWLLARRPGCLMLLHGGGVERLRLVHGVAAGEGALRHLAANILGALRSTDVVGLLGGSDFAILMPGADETAARLKLAEICARINGPPFTWMGQPVTLATLVGVHALAEGEGGEEALAAADRARRGL